MNIRILDQVKHHKEKWWRGAHILKRYQCWLIAPAYASPLWPTHHIDFLSNLNLEKKEARPMKLHRFGFPMALLGFRQVGKVFS